MYVVYNFWSCPKSLKNATGMNKEVETEGGVQTASQSVEIGPALFQSTWRMQARQEVRWASQAVERWAWSPTEAQSEYPPRSLASIVETYPLQS